jgi:hypothetical protein
MQRTPAAGADHEDAEWSIGHGKVRMGLCSGLSRADTPNRQLRVIFGPGKVYVSTLLKSLPPEPSLQVDALKIWVLGRQFPDATDEYDANWLNVVALCGGVGSRVEVSGPILDTVSFAEFLDSVSVMENTLTGEAELSSLEPNVKATLRYSDRQGHVEGVVEITADQLLERHRFTLSLDQSYLPSIRRQLERITEAFPIRGARRRGS